MTTDRKPAPTKLQFGSVSFMGWGVPMQLQRQVVQGLRTGPEVTREGREGVFTFALDSLDGGLSATSGIYSANRDKSLVYSNEGLMHHLPRMLCLPFKSTAQTAVTALDISGARTANKRVHGAMYKGRFYAFIDTQVFKDTSTSNPALTVPATADGITDKITAVATGEISGVGRVLAVAGSTNDDIQYTTDPTADTISWTKMVTLSDTPYINYLAYLNIGPGVWVFSGRPSTALGNGMWHFKQTATLPATPQPTVFTATKDILGTIASVTASSVDLTLVGVEQNSSWPWQGTSTGTTGTAGQTTGYAWYGNGDFSAIPRGADIIGIQGVTNATETNSNDDIFYLDLIVKAGGQTSISFAPAAELDTSGTDSWGGTSITGGLKLKGSDLDELVVGTKFIVGALESGANSQVTLTDQDITITYRMPGTMPVSSSLGGGAVSPLRWNPSRIANLEPETDELTAVTFNRRLRYDDYEWDSDGDRATVSFVYPPTGMAHIEDIEDFQGGVVCAGAPSSGVGQRLVLMDSQNIARDLGFPGVNGATAVRITSMFARGTALFYYVCNADSTDAQLWMYANGKHFAYGALFSKTLGGAMSTTPLAWAEKTMGLTQNQIYNFYPSSTNTAAVRQFVPFDPFSDPFLTNTTEVKQDGPLAIQTLELDVLPTEANKALMAIRCESRRVDNNTTYGSARVYIDTGGDHTIASAEVDQTFDAAGECFTDRNLASSNDPGVAYRTMITKIALDHQASSAETPNPLPLLYLIAASWPLLERFAIVLSKTGQISDFVTLMKRIKTLVDTKVSQRFTGAGYDIPAIIEDFKVEYNATLGTTPPSWEDVKSAVLTVRRTAGGLS